ncbi:APC family permease [Actinomyces slackii]|uniref:Putrescine importer PuuP n=1 Tax=Actinomyces slackii TaxID=52774 RepID=A0A448KAG3_9ACTO|nr:APC family permease [Actinomyces slackii]VEG73903.1 Putrescine importer PuuP [Actinomyces slackii]
MSTPSTDPPAGTPESTSAHPCQGQAAGLSRKGLAAGSVGLTGAIVIGVSCIAPAYTLTGALGPTVSAVGAQVPAIFLVGFLPMLLVALGYRELNAAMPDSGTSFTWGTKAFGPWVGWMSGWGLVVATVVVLSNLAGIAVDFFYLLLSQILGDPSVADLTRSMWVNIPTCLIFIAAATFVSYRDMQTTQRLQYWLVGFQLLVFLGFGAVALVRFFNGTAWSPTPIDPSWFNPLAVESTSTFIAGVSLSLFIYWGWDVSLTINEEADDAGSTPGRAAVLTVLTIVSIYMFVTIGSMAFAGLGDTGVGLGNPEIQQNVFFALSGPVLGPFAVLMSMAVLSSSAASLQSTFVSPARTLLAMGHYRALPEVFGRISPRFYTPGNATIISAVATSVFYTLLRLVSERVLWDTIQTLGAMIAFYYGLTACAAVWYFRGHWLRSARDFLLTLVAPGIGALILFSLLIMTLRDSMNPAYGSGSQIMGVGLVFILTLVLIGSGVVIMIIQYLRDPAFFRGEVIATSDAVADENTAREQGAGATPP